MHLLCDGIVNFSGMEFSKVIEDAVGALKPRVSVPLSVFVRIVCLCACMYVCVHACMFPCMHVHV